MSFLCFVFLINMGLASTMVPNKLDRYIIACHSTDFECFKRQYLALRDHALFGNKLLSIPTYQPFAFQYGDSDTCVMLTGLESSELIGISFDNINKDYSMVLQLPLKINQVKKYAADCTKPDREFVHPIQPHDGPLMHFTGNATVQVTYPYKLTKKKGEVHLELQDEDVDLVLDIPDLSHFDSANEVESRLFQWSEWAYEVVQHVDVAQQFVIPFTTMMHPLMEKVPLRKLILLYPEEEYTTLQFVFTRALQS